MGPSGGIDRRQGRAGRRPLVAVAVCALAMTCLATGCSSNHRDTGAGTAVLVTERDFHITASPAHIASGKVVITVQNRGPDNHELIVVRSDGRALPVRSDGVTIDEEALERATAGALEPGEPGVPRELRLRLRPGRYELFCNMSGHFYGGMRTELVVT